MTGKPAVVAPISCRSAGASPVASGSRSHGGTAHAQQACGEVSTTVEVAKGARASRSAGVRVSHAAHHQPYGYVGNRPSGGSPCAAHIARLPGS